MKCPFCAEDINDGAVICRHCGKKLRKSPAVAAILNFFFWGAGYLYCGRQWAVAILIPFILWNLLSIYQMQYEFVEFLPVQLIYQTIIGGLLALHAYRIAEDYNRQSNIQQDLLDKRTDKTSQERREEKIGYLALLVIAALANEKYRPIVTSKKRQ